MVKKPKKPEFPSELRFDLVSNDWVIIATGRAKKPGMFRKDKRIKVKIPKKDCPFCNKKEKPLLAYYRGKKLPQDQVLPEKWSTIVLPNKYPALLPYSKLDSRTEGFLYQAMNAVGFCELVVTFDHDKHFPHFTVEKTKEIFDVYQERLLTLMNKPLVGYVSIFHNHGPESGASQTHPHSQIITTPLIDVDLKNELATTKKYFKDNGKCLFCQMIDWEIKNKKRVVFENKDFLVICPFASKSAFEMVVSPKKHLSNFERIKESEKWQLAEAFGGAMRKLYKGLNDPPYNFYLHTAPSDKKDYSFYHWHWTILPKTSVWAGFEIGTRIEISTITPEKAAEYLRKQ